MKKRTALALLLAVISLSSGASQYAHEHGSIGLDYISQIERVVGLSAVLQSQLTNKHAIIPDELKHEAMIALARLGFLDRKHSMLSEDTPASVGREVALMLNNHNICTKGPTQGVTGRNIMFTCASEAVDLGVNRGVNDHFINKEIINYLLLSGFGSSGRLIASGYVDGALSEMEIDTRLLIEKLRSYETQFINSGRITRGKL